MFRTDTCHEFVGDLATRLRVDYNFTNSGFHITLANNYKVSVQWGPGTYSDNRYCSGLGAYDNATWTSETAEIALFSPCGKLVYCGGDDVRGWQNKRQVTAFILWASSIPNGNIVNIVPEFMGLE
jgi:hypothetical protein